MSNNAKLKFYDTKHDIVGRKGFSVELHGITRNIRYDGK